MKRFIKTLAGKTITFIACILSVCILAASIVGIIFYTQNGMEFYRFSEQDLQENYLVSGPLRGYGYTILWDQLSESPDYWEDFNYRIFDADGKLVVQTEDFTNVDAETYSLSYGVLKDENGKLTDIFYHSKGDPYDECAEYYKVILSLVEGGSAAIEFHLFSTALHTAYVLRYAIYFIALASLLLAIACFVALMYASGRRPDTDELVPGLLHKIPYDLLLAACGAIGIGLCYIGEELTYRNFGDIWTVICISVLCVVGLNMVLGLCMSAASRIKQHTFLKNTVIYRFIKLIWKVLRGIWTLLKKLHHFNASLVRGIPLVWKTGLAFCGISLLELLFIAWADGNQGATVVMWLIEKAILLPALLYLALILRRLQKSGAALANGDLSYHTDTKGMFWDFKQHGDNLNSIADGMAIAVEERMRSERLKTELITNVSHDIKTPLTSIINYATLIGGESCDNPKITEYSEVLVRQSEKLKRLIEDLVEASKASTGNLEVFLAPCDAAVFITQASGEYEEKLQKSELLLVTKQPEKDLRIMADGRRMWRIFDNLMNNICKYAQSGTRVYLTLEEQNGNAVISFKNTSREPLDMSEEELMERFTRGDSSRNTEGNGLGLSIAKSMAELQGGSLKLSIDGDLFKAILTFPLI
ncbi:MAG: sensor histidine kinase [Oscillibacter sp.]|nr:sensor histidine kinase [Oscillibacter sp.]